MRCLSPQLHGLQNMSAQDSSTKALEIMCKA